MKISILDYQMGNIGSVAKQFRSAGAKVQIASSASDIESADKIVLPGVGHFGMAMKNLKEQNLIDSLHEHALVKKKPILGICLGMQLMCSESEEGDTVGLGWFDAKVKKFEFEDTLNYKVPHIGWNSILHNEQNKLMKNISNESLFYFVHSYYVDAKKEDVMNSTSYGITFSSGIHRENIFGVQYHPEKSHDNGVQLIKNFLAL